MTAPALAALLALLGAAPAPIAAAPTAAAEPLAVRVRLDRKDVRLGEPFELTVEVRHVAAERYALPAPLPIEPFRLLGAGCPRREEGAEAVTTCALRLALYDLGAHDLPELVLRAETPGGARELRVPGPAVTGIGILDPAAPAASLGLKDLAPPAPLHVPNWPLAVGLLAAALSAAAARWGWRAWRWRSQRVEGPPPLPPHERFSRQLEALEEARLAAQGRGLEHFSRLSAHVREYLGAVTGQRALDLTSAELLARLSFQPDPRLDLGALRAFLEAADLVKFARAPATAAEADDALGFARTLLDRTRPRPPAPALPEGR
jgi:hypothetical protein